MRGVVACLVLVMVCVACTGRGCACCRKDDHATGETPEGAKTPEGTRPAVQVRHFEVVRRPRRDFAPAPRHFENAIHVQFDRVPQTLFAASQFQWRPNDDCRVGAAAFKQSTDEVLRVMSRFLGDTGVIEPSYGCRVSRPGERGPESLKNFWTLRPGPLLQDAQLVALSNRLRHFPGVLRAAPVPLVRPAFDPELEPFLGDGPMSADTQQGTQWYQFETNVVQAWSMVGPMDREYGPVVAVIDMGFRTTHDELAKVIDPTSLYNACYEDQKVDRGETDIWHGTAVAGILGASCDGNGIVGVAPDVKIWPIQGACEGERDQAGRPVEVGDSWGKAIQHVMDKRSPGQPTILLLAVETKSGKNIEANLVVHDAISRAVTAGFVVVVAAGNGHIDAGVDEMGNPIHDTGSILVGATAYRHRDQRADFSNYGERVLIYAPGDVDRDLTISAAHDGAYIASLGGTSGAAPKVAGVVAMMLSKDPQLTPDRVKAILVADGDFVEDGFDHGDNVKPRFLDAVKAVEKSTVTH